MNIREKINFILINIYVYFINYDKVINILVLNRLINIIHYRSKFVSRKKSRFNSINYIKYYINAKSRKYNIIIDLMFKY